MNKKRYVYSGNVRVYIALFVFVLVIVMVGLLSINKAGSINQRVNNIFTQELKPLETIEDIKASMYRIRERVGRHITEPERHDIHREKINIQLERLKRNENKYMQSRLSKEEQHLLTMFSENFNAYNQIIEAEVIPLSKKGRLEEAENVLYGKALDAFRYARKSLNTLSDYQIERAERRQENANKAYISILQLILGIIVAALILVLILVARYQHTYRAKKNRDLIINNTSQGLMITDNKLNIISVNEAFEQITGYSKKEIYNCSPSVLSSGRHTPDFYEEMWTNIKKTGRWEGEIWNKHKDEHVYPEWLSIVAIESEKGEIESYVGTFIDITELKAAEEKANKLAYFDDLTGLRNSHYLNKHLAGLLKKATCNDHQVGLILLDLNHFKDFNASLGRLVGDKILKEMAKLLEYTVPEHGLVTRYDSDRFMVALTCDSSSFAVFKEKMINFMRMLNEHHAIAIDNDSDMINVTWSAGIAAYPHDSKEVNTLLQQVNTALFYNKLEKHELFTFYRSEYSEQLNHRYELGLGLEKAIEKNELFLVFQPQVDRQGNVVGAEVLLRWHSSEFGIVAPDVFIPLAEENGKILEIGKWVFVNTLKHIKVWQLNSPDCMTQFRQIAINVSAYQVMSANITSEYDEACKELDISPELIELEITETGMMISSHSIIDRLKVLSNQGFSLAIDDFGTGYSSLGRLQDFPINILKIDRSFTQTILVNPTQAAIVQYIISMAHSLDMKVIAEGVEEQAEVNMLMGFGCDMFQGYHFAKPLAPDDFIHYVGNKSAKGLVRNLNG